MRNVNLAMAIAAMAATFDKVDIAEPVYRYDPSYRRPHSRCTGKSYRKAPAGPLPPHMETRQQRRAEARREAKAQRAKDAAHMKATRLANARAERRAS